MREFVRKLNTLNQIGLLLFDQIQSPKCTLKKNENKISQYIRVLKNETLIK